VTPQHDLTISIVLATHNRLDVLMNTLSKLGECGLPRDAYEIVVVDNASTDATAATVEPLVDRLVRLRRNRGSCAKAYGVDRARGRFIVFLDDDSHPVPGSLARMADHFERELRLGAAGFTVTLPDGRAEGSALPGVFVGCGVGLRHDALYAVGGPDRTFFMQAEEYDLSFRLAHAGWNVRLFDDLEVHHLKTPDSRRTERTTFYDTRNNLRVIARHLPAPYARVYREDCIQRYHWLAQRDGHLTAFSRGLRAGRFRAGIERLTYRRRRLSPEVFEAFYRLRQIGEHVQRLADSGMRRVVFADLGKNIFPFLQGARLAGLEVTAVGDDRFAAPGRAYRGIPVLPLEEALSQHCDAVVIANTGPVHATTTHRRLRRLTPMPIHDWFGRPGFVSAPPPRQTDDIAAALAAT